METAVFNKKQSTKNNQRETAAPISRRIIELYYGITPLTRLLWASE